MLIKGKKVAVLNFASAVNPGGGVSQGAMAQEECLCRSSNLLPCLKQKHLMKDYYMSHRIANNPLYSDKIIRYTAGKLNCKVMDLYDYHLPYDSIDGSHPNAQGMNTLATMMIREIGGKEVEQFMNYGNGQYEFGLRCIQLDY